jgi:A/G-specific adenine glycosylase
VRPLSPLVHVFTHYKLHIAPFAVTLATRAELAPGHVWWPLETIGEAPLPAPVKKLLLDLAQPSLFG